MIPNYSPALAAEAKALAEARNAAVTRGQGAVTATPSPGAGYSDADPTLGQHGAIVLRDNRPPGSGSPQAGHRAVIRGCGSGRVGAERSDMVISTGAANGAGRSGPPSGRGTRRRHPDTHDRGRA